MSKHSMPGRPDPDVLQHLVLTERLPASQVGGRLGLSRAAGYSLLHRYGITATATAVSQHDLVRRWRAGTSVEDLAAATSLPEDAVRERLVAAAVMTATRHYFFVGAPDDPLPEHLLRELYVRQGFSAPQVAAMTATTARQVRYRLTRYRLSRRRPGPAPQLHRVLTAQLLKTLYVERELTCRHIAKQYQVSIEAVRKLLAAYDITRRPSRRPVGTVAPVPPDVIRAYQKNSATLEQLAVQYGFLTAAGNPAVRRLRSALAAAGVDTRRGANWATRLSDSHTDTDDATLHRLYRDDGLTIAQIAERLGWNTPTGKPAVSYTRNRLLIAGVTLRKRGPAKASRNESLHRASMATRGLVPNDDRSNREGGGPPGHVSDVVSRKAPDEAG